MDPSKNLVFTLEKKAKSAGGDKYVCNNPDFTIYVPQVLTRKDNTPAQSLYVTVQHISSASDSLEFTLDKKAKSAGGDKYVCPGLPDFNMYVPQVLARKDNKPVQPLYVTVKPDIGQP